MNRIETDYSLITMNTFGTDARAGFFAQPQNLEELAGIFDRSELQDLPFLVLGEGSNILFRNDFEGFVLNPAVKGIEILEEDHEEVVVRVGAGENWDTWVQYATSQGWFGLENLSLIPGSVGASPIQNIGAYGVEISEFLDWLDAFDREERKVIRFSSEDCRFGYRTSLFREDSGSRYIITHVAFRLKRKPFLNLDYGNVREELNAVRGKTPMDLRKVIIHIREQKLPDPYRFGNAGSFFKNPLVDMTIFKCIRVDFQDVPNYPSTENRVKIPAAWLIEQAGWKGIRRGNVGTWPKQPLVIVNYGGATGEDILEFTEQIRQDVDQKFGVYLEREVTVV